MAGVLSGMIGSMKGATAPTTAPTSLSAIPTNTNVAISFTAPTNDGGSAITNYEYSFNNSSWTALSPADAVSPVTVSGLTQNTGYTVYLRGVNIVGSGPASSGVTFTTAGIPTGTTTISGVTVTTTTATVSFSTTAGGSEITGYDYYLTSWVDAATATSPKVLSGLSSNTSYTVYMRPKNAYGSGSQSAGVGFTTNPTFISATGGTTFDYTSGGFGYRSHTFTNNGNFVVSSVGSFGTIDLHMIGGGGGGGYSYGGGGGGGGARTDTNVAISATSYSIVIGGAGYQGQDVGSGYSGGVGGTTTGFGLSVGGGGGGTTNVQGGAAAPTNGGGGGGGNLNYIGASSNGSYGSAGGGVNSGGGNGGSGYNQPNAYRTGSNETRATGGLGSPANGNNGAAGSGYGAGGGGGGIYCNVPYRGGNASAGAVILRYRIS